MDVNIINTKEAKRFVASNHYAITTPSTVRVCYGFYVDNKLTGVSVWGFGVRPLHTIRKLFPSLGTKDYLELNRLCLLDSMPRNSETEFISKCVKMLKQDFPNLRILFSWADGLRGKVGYVYQASNWLYGGFIKSEFYLSKDNEVVHPRLIRTRYKTRTVWQKLGLRHVWGYQFRYCKLIGSHKENKILMKETLISWSIDYPKEKDLMFWIQNAGEESREIRQLPKLEGSGQFRSPAPLFLINN